MTDKFNGLDERHKALEAHADFERDNYPALYKEGLERLTEAGYLLIPDMVGPYAYHRVYRLCHPDTPGLTIPENFKVWKEVLTADDKELLVDLILGWGNPVDKENKLAKFWRPFHQPNKNRNSPIYVHTENMVRDMNRLEKAQEAGEPVNLYLTPDPVVSGTSRDKTIKALAPITWLPKREWFPQSLQGVTVSDILTIFPAAERNLLSLVIGRAVVGRSNHLPPGYDKPIIHTARMAAILLGEDPGLGKTTLMKALLVALEKQGYTVETFSEFGARFNMGPIVSSHITYKDDLADKDLKNLVGSGVTKQIISSADPIKVEDKGKDAYSAFPNTVLFSNTNNFNPRLIWDIDPGMADRLKLISTYRGVELLNIPDLSPLCQGSSDLRPFIHIPYLCEKTGVTPDTLMLWLARLCADKFLNLIQNRTDLEEEVDRLSMELREPLHKDNVSQFMMAAFTACLYFNRGARATFKIAFSKGEIQVASDVNWKQLLDTLQELINFDKEVRDSFKDQLRQHYEEQGDSDPLHPYVGFKLLDLSSLDAAMEKSGPISSDKDRLDLLSKVLSKTRQITGLPYSHDPVWIVKGFNKIRPGLYERVEAIIKELD
jgi:Family of unknown function (DUF5906)